MFARFEKKWCDCHIFIKKKIKKNSISFNITHWIKCATFSEKSVINTFKSDESMLDARMWMKIYIFE